MSQLDTELPVVFARNGRPSATRTCIEHRASNLRVGGSNPSRRATLPFSRRAVALGADLAGCATRKLEDRKIPFRPPRGVVPCEGVSRLERCGQWSRPAGRGVESVCPCDERPTIIFSCCADPCAPGPCRGARSRASKAALARTGTWRRAPEERPEPPPGPRPRPPRARRSCRPS